MNRTTLRPSVVVPMKLLSYSLVLMVFTGCAGESGTLSFPNNDDLTETEIQSETEPQAELQTDLLITQPSPNTRVNILDEDNWQNLVVGVVSVINDSALGETSRMLDSLRLSEEDAALAVSSATPLRTECIGGGYFDVAVAQDNSGTQTIVANECVFPSTPANSSYAIDGHLVLDSFVNEFGLTVERSSFTNFSLEDGTRLVAISFGVREHIDNHPFIGTEWRNLSYQVNNAGAIHSVANAERDDDAVFGIVFDRILSTNFRTAGSWSAHQFVSIDADLSGRPANGQFGLVRGELIIETNSENRLTMDADSGQSNDSALITIEQNGSVTTHLLAWDVLFPR